MTRPPMRPTSEQIGRARELRAPTDAERRLWSFLPATRFGLKLRRQHPFGPCVLDFYCHELKLVIELDGGQHYEDEGIRKDTRRTAYLEAQRMTVVRFTNTDVLLRIDGVGLALAEAVEKLRGQKRPLP